MTTPMFCSSRPATRFTTPGRSSTDLRTEGDTVWQRFTVPDPRAQLWYYTSVAEILQRRLPGPLTDELAGIVSEIAVSPLSGP